MLDIFKVFFFALAQKANKTLCPTVPFAVMEAVVSGKTTVKVVAEKSFAV